MPLGKFGKMDFHNCFKGIFNNKTVFVTGHTGFQGTWLSLWLKKMGANVIGYSIDIPTEPSFFEIVNLKDDITNISGDIKDYDHLKSSINEFKPDILLIYNHGWLNPEQINIFKTQSKVIYFLVDSPFYTPNSLTFLQSLFAADHVYVIDSMWEEQLKTIGISNISLLHAGVDTNTFYRLDPPPTFKKNFSSDIIFIGNAQKNVNGFKRALFLNNFTNFDFKLHGNSGWGRWFDVFPKLKNKFVLKKNHYSFSKVNMIYNCSKIAPIEAYTGVINGIHPKLYDCIASGILPIIEYRKDIESTFKGIEIPLIRSYAEIKEITSYYLNNETKRKQVIDDLRNYVLNNYTSLDFAKILLRRN